MTMHPDEDRDMSPLAEDPEGGEYLTKVMKSIESHWNLGRIQPVYFSSMHFEDWYEEIERWGITWGEITRVGKLIRARQPFKDAFPTISDVLDMVRPHRHKAPIEPMLPDDPESAARKRALFEAARQRQRGQHE